MRSQPRGDVQSENWPSCEPQTSCRRQSCNPVPPRASTPLMVLDSYNQYQPINFLGQLLHGGKQQILTTWQSCTASPQVPRQKRTQELHTDSVKSIKPKHWDSPFYFLQWTMSCWFLELMKAIVFLGLWGETMIWNNLCLSLYFSVSP